MLTSGYPKSLSAAELYCLKAAMPAHLPAYRRYLDFFDTARITGACSGYEGNFLLAPAGLPHDSSLPPSPVIALAEMRSGGMQITVTVQEMFEGYVEVEIMPVPVAPPSVAEVIWSVAHWAPGSRMFPQFNGAREVALTEKYSLVCCAALKKLWLHNVQSGVNTVIPASTYHNELLRIRGRTAAGGERGATLLFAQIPEATDTELRYAFWAYNKIFRRAELPPAPPDNTRAGYGFMNLLSRD